MRYTTFDPQHLCSFDLETTGPNPRTARIVTSSCLTIDIPTPQLWVTAGSAATAEEIVEPGEVTPADPIVTTHNWLANPGCPIPEGATRVHGITTEHAHTYGRPHGEVARETVDFIKHAWAEGRTLVVYNSSYDLTILRHWVPEFTVDGPVFDPFVIDRAIDPYRKGKRTLSVVCEHYGVSLDNAHNSDADAWGAACLVDRLCTKYPQLRELTAEELMNHQKEWHRKRQESFREYLSREGRDPSTVSIEWPVLPL